MASKKRRVEAASTRHCRVITTYLNAVQKHVVNTTSTIGMDNTSAADTWCGGIRPGE
jgi:hypothetical protein